MLSRRVPHEGVLREFDVPVPVQARSAPPGCGSTLFAFCIVAARRRLHRQRHVIRAPCFPGFMSAATANSAPVRPLLSRYPASPAGSSGIRIRVAVRKVVRQLREVRPRLRRIRPAAKIVPPRVVRARDRRTPPASRPASGSAGTSPPAALFVADEPQNNPPNGVADPDPCCTNDRRRHPSAGIPAKVKRTRVLPLVLVGVHHDRSARSDRRFEPHFTRFAVSRARLSDGSRIEISSAMMPMTTSNSTSVNARRLRRGMAEELTSAPSGRNVRLGARVMRAFYPRRSLLSPESSAAPRQHHPGQEHERAGGLWHYRD
jgi:hypothetical protein